LASIAQVRVDRAHIQGVAQDRDAAIHAAAARASLGRGLVMVGPEHAARRRVQRDDVVRRLHGIENAVDDERRCLELLERARLPDPLQLELADRPRIDLIEPAVALVVDRARIAQPVLRLAPGGDDALERDLRLQRQAREERCEAHDRSHGVMPRSEER
jgi:hypothetical protein